MKTSEAITRARYRLDELYADSSHGHWSDDELRSYGHKTEIDMVKRLPEQYVHPLLKRVVLTRNAAVGVLPYINGYLFVLEDNGVTDFLRFKAITDKQYYIPARMVDMKHLKIHRIFTHYYTPRNDDPICFWVSEGNPSVSGLGFAPASTTNADFLYYRIPTVWQANGRLSKDHSAGDQGTYIGSGTDDGIKYTENFAASGIFYIEDEEVNYTSRSNWLFQHTADPLAADYPKGTIITQENDHEIEVVDGVHDTLIEGICSRACEKDRKLTESTNFAKNYDQQIKEFGGI